jgi:hypothetical protein
MSISQTITTYQASKMNTNSWWGTNAEKTSQFEAYTKLKEQLNEHDERKHWWLLAAQSIPLVKIQKVGMHLYIYRV